MDKKAMDPFQERMKKRKAFYASLGECITAWADVERQLFDLFHRALLGLNDDKEKSALLFWTFPTFGMRLSYTSMLINYCIKTGHGSHTKAQKYWKKLSKDLEELHSFRNILAHQPTAKDKIYPPIDEDRGDMIIWAKDMVIPNKLDKKKSFKPIMHNDLEVHLKSVSLIRERLKTAHIYFPSWEAAAIETFSHNDEKDQEETAPGEWYEEWN